MKSELKIRVREMDFEDVHRVFEIGELNFTADKFANLYRTWDEYEILERFISDGEYCLVAEDSQSNIVGFIIGTVIKKRKSAWSYGYFIWIGVDPVLRGKGIGRKLVNRLTRTFRNEGVRMVIADTSKNNQSAINFFKKRGFKEEDEQVYMVKNISKGKK